MSLVDAGKTPISVGPWGGQEGTKWDDGVSSTVRQLTISHGSCIDSIQIEYDRKGNCVWSEKHGGTGGQNTNKVKLESPDEFLTSFHGHYGSLSHWGPVLIRSLTFESNKRSYGPYGTEQGTHFSLPTTGGKIVGFHGKSGWFLDAIGVYLKPIQKPNLSKPLFKSPQLVSNGTESIGYSVMQGSIGQSYDIVLAIRHRDENYSNHYPPQGKPLMQFSDFNDFSDGATKDKVHKVEKAAPKVETITKKVENNLPKVEKIMPKIETTTPKVENIMPKIKGAITYGPWGGTGGAVFEDGMYSGIKQIHISRNVGIVKIRILYDQNGQDAWGSKHGGKGSFKRDKIVFDYPSEILTHMTGCYGPLMYMGPNIIKSLTFYTNKGKYGPFGEEQGNSFTTRLKEGKIVGLHGREGLFIDAIGVHVIEGTVTLAKHHITRSDAIVASGTAIAEIDNAHWSNKLMSAKGGLSEEVACGVIKDPAPCGPGPWGGDGGRPWDDGVFSGIRQIYVTRGDAICSIQIEYDRNGQSIWSVKHGGNNGIVTHRVKLEYPHELLICVTGYYGSVTKDERPKVIKSLTFYTSRGKYGPFGEEVGTFFTSTTTEGKVVGFHGRSSLYLDAIGVHMQHWLGNQKATKQSLFKYF